MNDDDPDAVWAAYAAMQAKADSSQLDWNAWATDAALETILEHIERDEQDASRLVRAGDSARRNRQRKYRAREQIVERHRAFFVQDQITLSGLGVIEARMEFERAKSILKPGDFDLLCDLAMGCTFEEAAAARGENINTLKARVARARAKL